MTQNAEHSDNRDLLFLTIVPEKCIFCGEKKLLKTCRSESNFFLKNRFSARR